MKKLIRTALAVTMISSFALLGSCKDKEAQPVETDSTMDGATSSEQDSATVVNDSNVSGVTSGTMEQVP